MQIPDALKPWADQIERELGQYCAELSVPVLAPAVRYQIESGGKRLRPIFTAWLAEELGNAGTDSLPFALAVEFLHNVFLIHDDIEDGDTYRRGRPTLWVEHGLNDALNCGDFMLAEAYRSLANVARDAECRCALLENFTDTFRVTVEGQALDLAWRADPEFTLAAYDEIIVKKTGRYLALGWIGAALIAGRTTSEAQLLWSVGEQLGPAFQIRDDVLDLTAGKGRGGEIGCDVKEGKPSILFAYALERGGLTGSQRDQLIEIMARDRDRTSAEDVETAIQLYRNCGALQYAEEEAERRGSASIEAMRELAFVPPSAQRTFQEIANYVRQRNV